MNGDGVPVVNQKAIRWDGIRKEFLKFLTEKFQAQIRRMRLTGYC